MNNSKLSRLLLTTGLVFGSQWSIPATAMQPEVTSMPAFARRGERVNFAIKTNPGAQCKIQVQGELPQFLQLMPVTADKNGKASWTFDVNRNFKADKMPMIVTTTTKGEPTDQKLVTSLPIASRKPNSNVKLSLHEQTASIAPGQDVTVSVLTNPGTRCNIEAQGVGITQALALAGKTADKTGKVTWKFNVKDTYKADKLPIVVTGKYKNGVRKLVSAIPINREL